MKMYYDGLQDQIDKIRKMSEQELYNTLDALYGRDNLPQNPERWQLESEAIEQVKKDFLTPEGKQEQAWIKHFVGAMKNR